ncbi:QWRF motif-containing protein 2 [Manihot esculenta]|uniref:QWRF motif-containing protein 2 n=1 Tax=Manihot esculenta TaxID=3983 RepID=UPI001CC5DEF0|nr:QWRF motif-containing protein 2 [Manihot esculenta]
MVQGHPRTIASSIIRGATGPASPTKLWTPTASSPSRGISSPSRVRPMSSYPGSTPSILSFSVDLRRGKMGEDRIVDARMLRLLYNRYLQWRFVNARADASFLLHRLNAEKIFWNVWVTITELQHSVILKRIKLLLLRQKLKLTSIFKGQDRTRGTEEASSASSCRVSQRLPECCRFEVDREVSRADVMLL